MKDLDHSTSVPHQSAHSNTSRINHSQHINHHWTAHSTSIERAFTYRSFRVLTTAQHNNNQIVCNQGYLQSFTLRSFQSEH